MSRFALLPIRSQLLVLAILLTLPALGIIVYSGIKESNERYHDAVIETQKLADNLKARQENIITEAQLLANLLADLPDVHLRNNDKVQAILTNIHKKNPQYQSILIADQSGSIWASSIPGMVNASVAERRYFKNARSSMQFSSGEFAVHKVLNTPTISMAHPLVDKKGNFDGVIILSYDLGVMRSILYRSQLPSDTNYRLVDHNGVVISSAIDADIQVGESLPVEQFRQMQKERELVTTTFTREDGDQRIYTSRKLWLKGENTPYMYILATISATRAKTEANRNLLLNVSLLLPFVLSAFLLAFFIGKRSITDRVAVLRSASQQISEGNLWVRVAGQVEGGELGELGQSFDEMAERLSADIARSVLVEEALQRELLLTNAIFDSVPGLLYLYDEQGNLIRWNKKHETITGYSAEELAGMKLIDWYRHSDEDYEIITRGVQKCLSEGYAESIANLQIKDGSKIRFSFTAVRLEIKGKTFFAGIGIDITEREKLQDELLKIQKLESLGVLAGGIAHDFNNVLTGIMGNISFAKMVVDESHEAFKPLLKAEIASQRAADLAKKLLIFAKGGDPVKKPLYLQRILNEAVMLAISGTIVKFVMECPQSLHVIEADEGQIRQSIQNIIINAIQAMPSDGNLTVYGENIYLSTDNSMGLAPGDYVKIAITDDGCGISEEDQKKIFDPYFSTKDNMAGLGLASSHAIIARHGGLITVESTVGIGTTFVVYLPAATDTTVSEQSGKAGLMDNPRSILVMDDEEMIRDFASMMIRRLGYKVETCINGDEAIAMYRSAMHAGMPFAAVIMDLTIPGGMGGADAAEIIRSIDPDACLIVSSGYSDDPVMANYREYGFCAAMGKPYKAETIAQVLAEFPCLETVL
jgi:PAS domain S-box-containing protein